MHLSVQGFKSYDSKKEPFCCLFQRFALQPVETAYYKLVVFLRDGERSWVVSEIVVAPWKLLISLAMKRKRILFVGVFPKILDEIKK